MRSRLILVAIVAVAIGFLGGASIKLSQPHDDTLDRDNAALRRLVETLQKENGTLKQLVALHEQQLDEINAVVAE